MRVFSLMMLAERSEISKTQQMKTLNSTNTNKDTCWLVTKIQKLPPNSAFPLGKMAVSLTQCPHRT